MINHKRHKRLLKLLDEREHASVQQLMEWLSASAATVRAQPAGVGLEVLTEPCVNASAPSFAENQVGLPGFTATLSNTGTKPSAAKAERTTS